MQRILDVIPAKPRTRLGGWGAAVAIMATLSVLQYGLAEYSGASSLFLLLPGVFICGFLFDRGSSTVATLIAIAASVYMFAPILPHARAVAPLTIFGVVCIATSLASEVLRKALEQLASAERAKDILLHELSH